MTSKKRGLGRGLEALLVDVPVGDDREDAADAVASMQEVERLKAQLSTTTRKQEIYPLGHKEQLPSKQASVAAEGRLAAVAAGSIENIQRESDHLLEEAESLINLLDEFELMVRRLEID